MGTDLTRIGERARRNRKEKFTSLYHHVTELENLRASWNEIERAAAPGIDGIRRDEYGQNLEENLKGLKERLERMSYRPKPVRRVYIPKAGSKKKRPLGIPSEEDKIVQKALVRVLEQIYEADFERSSYGYRPGRTQHQALDELGRTIQQKKINWVVEADIKGFYDHVNQEWLEKMLEERIGDPRVLRLIKRMLRAGVMEEGLTSASEEGVPQGGPLSPMLSNVYLHYALDLWFERVFRKRCRGEAYYIRYADDYLACFQSRTEAEVFLKEMKERLEKFRLEIEESKTKADPVWTICGEGRPRRRRETRAVRLSGIHALLREDAVWGVQGKAKDIQKEISDETERSEGMAQEGAKPAQNGGASEESQTKVSRAPQLLRGDGQRADVPRLQLPVHTNSLQMAEPAKPETKLHVGAVQRSAQLGRVAAGEETSSSRSISTRAGSE